MKKLIILNTFIVCLAVALLISVKSSLAGAPVFQIGPDGDAYKLVDCSIPENNADLSLCDNADDPGVGVISWQRARNKAQDMTFRGFSCDLATPTTEQINNYLETFPGFVDACNTCTGAGNNGFEICAWFGIRDVTDDDLNGPFRYVNNSVDDVPCPFGPNNRCNPRVDPGIDTPFLFEDWCSVPNGCSFFEPNSPTLDEFFVGFARNNNTGVVGWYNCTAECPLFTRGNPTCFANSYFVECELPVPAITLAPETATNEIFTEHTVTAMVLLGESPEVGVLVDFEILSGPNAGEMSDPNEGECTPNDDCTTDENGQVSWTYMGDNKVPGTDIIVASFFEEFTDSDIESNTVEKIWVRSPRPIPTLSEWGLIAMAAVLGIIGLLALRRRKAAA